MLILKYKYGGYMIKLYKAFIALVTVAFLSTPTLLLQLSFIIGMVILESLNQLLTK
jgi:hypothetical protein